MLMHFCDCARAAFCPRRGVWADKFSGIYGMVFMVRASWLCGVRCFMYIGCNYYILRWFVE